MHPIEKSIKHALPITITKSGGPIFHPIFADVSMLMQRQALLCRSNRVEVGEYEERNHTTPTYLLIHLQADNYSV